jgi:hypothetical protein
MWLGLVTCSKRKCADSQSIRTVVSVQPGSGNYRHVLQKLLLQVPCVSEHRLA